MVDTSVSESILNSIKKVLGIDKEYTNFDVDILMHINTAFSILHQIGASPSTAIVIMDDVSTWDEFIEGRDNVEMVKSYVAMKVRLMFDPPSSAFGTDSMQKQIDALEWRLSLMEDVFKPVEEV